MSGGGWSVPRKDASSLKSVEEDSSLITFSTAADVSGGRNTKSTWYRHADERHSGGSAARTQRKGDYAMMNFEGQAVALMSTKGISHGIIQVSLDGRVVTLDGHCCDENPENPFMSEKVKVILWKEEKLSDKPHVLQITNWDDGKILEIDAILIKTHPTPEEYDPTNSRRVLYPFFFLICFGAVVWLCIWISAKRNAKHRQYKSLSTRDDDDTRESVGLPTGAQRVRIPMTSLRSNGMGGGRQL